MWCVVPALSVLTRQCLLTRLETVTSMAVVDGQCRCWLVYHSGARLQSSLDLGGQRPGWEERLSSPVLSNNLL